VEENTFPFDVVNISSEFAYRFGFKGPVMDSMVPTKEVESFLSDHKPEFEKIAQEHIKKINLHKEGKIR